MPKEYDRKKEIKCPHCDHEFEDSCEHQDDDDEVIQCENCDESFNLSVHVSVYYSTSVIDCNDGEHDWLVSECSENDQEEMDRRRRNPFWKERYVGKKPHQIWSRECRNCTDKEYKETPPNSKDPWDYNKLTVSK